MAMRIRRTERRQDPKPVRLTDRDEAILLSLYRFNMLTIDQVHQLVGGSRQGVQRRLRLLLDAGYITRPEIQTDIFRYGDKRPTVQCLGNQGADFLRLEHGLKIPKTINWDRKAKDRLGVRGGFIMRHDIGANGAVIALQKALEALEGVEVLTAAQIVAQAPEPTQKAKEPYSIPTQFKWVDGSMNKRNAKPDGVLGYVDRRNADPIRAVLFVEYDQRMNINKTDPQQPSIFDDGALVAVNFHHCVSKGRPRPVNRGQLKSLSEPIDMSDPVGRAAAQMLFVFAELERANIVERTNAGLEHARRNGRKGGRPPALSKNQQTRVRRRHKDGESISHLAREYGVSRQTIQRVVQSTKR